jgi:hypothetical protein
MINDKWLQNQLKIDYKLITEPCQIEPVDIIIVIFFLQQPLQLFRGSLYNINKSWSK